MHYGKNRRVEKMKEKFKKLVRFKPPLDKRYPDPEKNYGIRFLTIWFILIGKKGAVQVMLITSCYLNSVIKEYARKGKDLFYNEKTIDCYDVGYHSFKPMFKGQKSMKCDVLEGEKCFYDGSSLKGKRDKVGQMFLEKGEKVIWEYLEKYYKDIFE